MSESLRINLLASEDFDRTSRPLIFDAFEARGHQVRLVPAEAEPHPDGLLDGDVFIDRSPITDPAFFRSLAHAYFRRRAEKRPVPLMVDNPFATIASMDKRKTHDLMPDLVPESYNLDGQNNKKAIGHFAAEQYVVIKDPLGWDGRGVERLSPDEALARYGTSKDLIVQEYIPFDEGVGRLYTLNHNSDFEIMCAYLVVPNSWRTGEGTQSRRRPTAMSARLYDFARTVSKRSGLYLNGIDYIHRSGRDVLLEVNSVPNLAIPQKYLGVDLIGMFVRHVERSAVVHAR